MAKQQNDSGYRKLTDFVDPDAHRVGAEKPDEFLDKPVIVVDWTEKHGTWGNYMLITIVRRSDNTQHVISCGGEGIMGLFHALEPHRAELPIEMTFRKSGKSYYAE